MTRDRFEAILRNLHLVDNGDSSHNQENADYDKLSKCQWLVEEVKSRCERNWNLR